MENYQRKWSKFLVEMTNFLGKRFDYTELKTDNASSVSLLKYPDLGYEIAYIVSYKQMLNPSKGIEARSVVFETLRRDGTPPNVHLAVLYNVSYSITHEDLDSIGKKGFLELKDKFSYTIDAMMAAAHIKS